MRPFDLVSLCLAAALPLAAGCGGESPAPPVSTDAKPAPEAASDRTASDAGPSASGFVELVVDGETKRFEHLPAKDNELNLLALELKAQESAENEHGVEVVLMVPRLAAEELPQEFDGFDSADMEAGVTPYKMAMYYRGDDGESLYVVDREAEPMAGIRLDSIDGRTVRGSFLPGRYIHSKGQNDPITIEGGSFEIELAKVE